MGNEKRLLFRKISFGIFAIATIISIFLVYKDIDSNFTFKFLVGYLILTFIFLTYMFLVSILNLRKLKWESIKKRLLKFIILFFIFGVSSYGFDYFFRPPTVDLFRVLPIAFGLAFSISFVSDELGRKKRC